jgi:ribonuclease HI
VLNIHIDGAARGNPGPSGYGIFVSDKEGSCLEEAYGFLGNQTNNYAEYTAMIAAMNLALLRGWKDIHFFSDSQLMVKQLKGEYKVKNPGLAVLFREVSRLRRKFNHVKLDHVKREFNKDADRLANKAVDTQVSNPVEINPQFLADAGQKELF